MKLQFTCKNGDTTYVETIRNILKNTNSSIDIVAHRIDLVFFKLYEKELKIIEKKNIHFRFLLSNTHIESCNPAINFVKSLCSNIQFRIASNIHAKLIISDNISILLGSANFTGDSIGLGSEWNDSKHHWDKPNFEVGLFIVNQELSNQLSDIFNKHWEDSEVWKI